MRANEFLVEYSRDITAQKWANKLIMAGQRDSYIRQAREAWTRQFLEAARNPETQNVAATLLLSKFEEADPTPHKEYVQWLVKIFATLTTKFEDVVSRAPTELARFVKLKNKKQLAPEHRDINKYKTLSQLEATLSQYPEMEEQQTDRGQYKEYYKDADLRVIIPVDEKAACFWGQGTKWCTAAKKNNMFNTYSEQGTLYIVIPTKTHHAGEKYQFHFESGQFMDDSDTPIDLKSWVKVYPQLKTIFHEQAKKNLTIPLLNNADELYKQFEVAKEQQFQFAHKTLMHNVGGVAKGMFNDFMTYGTTADEARRLVDTVWEAIQEDSYGLVSNVLFRLTIESVQSDDGLWDTGYFAVEDWVSGSDIGTIANELEEQSDYDREHNDRKALVDAYGIVNTVANDLYEKFVKMTAVRLKEAMQAYIK